MSLAKQAQLIENNLSEFWEEDDSAFAMDMAMAKDKEDKDKKEKKDKEEDSEFEVGPGTEIEAILVEEDDEGGSLGDLGDLGEKLEAIKDGDPEEEDGAILQIEEIDDDRPVQAFTFSMPLIPGSDLEEGDIDELSVDEPEEEVEVEERDQWDWAGVGLTQFMGWLQGMLGAIPPHSGNDISGVERALAYLEALDRIISKAVRSDLKNELDIQQIELARHAIRDGINRLQDRYERLMAGTKRNKKKAEMQESLVKEAQKITGVGHVVVTVPLLISRIARVCINGMVSAGHDIEDMFDRQAKTYNLDKREQAELLQLLEDMGYSMRRDRGFLRDEQIDTTRSDNFDWAANYPG